MNYNLSSLVMTNVLVFHSRRVSLISKIHFFRFLFWRCDRFHWHYSSPTFFLEMSYLVQASGALRIYTLVDLKALEDERKKFDKRKIHGLLQEKNIVYENHQKKVSFSNLNAKSKVCNLNYQLFNYIFEFWREITQSVNYRMSCCKMRLFEWFSNTVRGLTWLSLYGKAQGWPAVVLHLIGKVPAKKKPWRFFFQAD